MLWTTSFIFNKDVADKKISIPLIVQIIFLSLSFLSCPLSFMLLPGIAIGFILRINERKALTPQLMLYLLPVVLMILHILFTLTHPDVSRGSSVPIINVLNFLSGDIFSWFAFIGSSASLTNIGYIPLYIASIIIMAILIYISIKRSDYLINCWLLGIIVMNVVILYLQRQDYLGNFSAMIVYRGIIGGRFLLIPITIILLIIIRDIDIWQNKQGIMARLFNYIPYILLLIFIINVTINYELQPFDDLHYKQYAALYEPEGNMTYTIPLNPPGWGMEVTIDTKNIQILKNMTL
jgi:hypothetical protein